MSDESLESWARHHAEMRRVAQAWQAAWASGESPEWAPWICESCCRPAGHVTVDDVYLCDGCWDMLAPAEGGVSRG